jgi:hypothetical protein
MWLYKQRYSLDVARHSLISPLACSRLAPNPAYRAVRLYWGSALIRMCSISHGEAGRGPQARLMAIGSPRRGLGHRADLRVRPSWGGEVDRGCGTMR